MKNGSNQRKLLYFELLSLMAMLSLAAISGCKKAPTDDATLTKNVKAALSADATIATQPIQPSVLNGVVTLNGNVSSDTARTVAEQDTTRVGGVKEVINAITIQGFDGEEGR
jgi:osmotically-inducible protein OsmY